LKGFAKGLEIPGLVIAGAIDEESRGAIGAAPESALEIVLDAIPGTSAGQHLRYLAGVRSCLLSVAQQGLGPEVPLVLVEEIVHSPELSLQRHRLGRLRGGLSMGMDIAEGQVAKDKAKRCREDALQLLDDGECLAAVGTLVIAVLD
jgi:hypothetical protein